MKTSKVLILIITLSLLNCNNEQTIPEITVGIGKYYKNDLPYIIKFPNKLPKKEIRQKLPILVIISWKYDGKSNNGLPTAETNTKMLVLEKESKENNVFFHAYTRTGNNLKEIIYYCSNKEDFMAIMNGELKNKPIEIEFIKDEQWDNLSKTIRLFNKH